MADLLDSAAVQKYDLDPFPLTFPGLLEVLALLGDIERRSVCRICGHRQNPEPARTRKRGPPFPMSLQGANNGRPPAQAEKVLRFRAAQQLPGQLLERRQFGTSRIDRNVDP